MFSVTIRDHMMVAQASGAVFGPGQRLHGATCAVVSVLSYRNLVDEPEAAL